MSKPEDIPQDVWNAAWAALGYRREPRSLSGQFHTLNVARAILAERERCAVLASGDAPNFDFEKALAECRDSEYGANSARLQIAIDIRKGAV